MAKTRRSAVITSDGALELPANASIRTNETYGAPELPGYMVVRTRSDLEVANAAALWQQEIYDMVVGKSGGSRVGMEVIARPEADADFDTRNRRIALPVSVMSLRAVQVRQNGVRDDLLTVLQEMTEERDVQIGRLLLANPSDALSKGQIMDAQKKQRLAVPFSREKLDECVNRQGVMSLPLEDLHYAFCESNFRTEQKRGVIRYGKHGLDGLQEERHGKPKKMEGKEFFVGGIRLSIGPYVAVIDRDTNSEGVIHLAARILDGVRTTGLDVVRQVELFNTLYKSVSMKDLRVNIRLYHGSKDMQDFAHGLIDDRTIVQGVSLADVLQLQDNPDRVIDMMHEISPSVADGNPAGYLVGPGKAHKVKWVDNASAGFQHKQLEITAPKFSAGDQDYCVRGDEMPQAAEELAQRLGYVGQHQSHSKMYFSWAFPDTDTIRHMHQSGIGVFVAHDMHETDETYTRETPLLNRRRKMTGPDGQEQLPFNDNFMNDQEFAAIQKLHRDGVRFLNVRHPAVDKFGEVDELPEEVLEWHERGFWVRPEAKEAVEKVDTLITMYGSHVKGIDDALEPQLARFALRMKRLFGDKVGFMHGRGPGVMYLADKIARKLPEYAAQEEGFEDITEPMVSVGIGIDLEQAGQAINHHPDAQLNFRAQSRLIRQKHMNDRASFNIINLGGAGTLEEIALTICSQKLYKNLLTPIIFVDPFGISNEGDNFWNKLKEFVADMSTKKVIEVPQRDGSVQEVPVTAELLADAKQVEIQLLQGHMQNMMHVLNGYDEAAQKIEDFVADPVAYYKQNNVTQQEFATSFASAIDVRRETRFPMPHWMDGVRYAEMMERTDWPVDRSQIAVQRDSAV